MRAWLVLVIVAACAPTPRPIEVALWPGAVPDAQSVGTELTAVSDGLVAGKPWSHVANVSRPTLTIYPARGVRTGAAVVVIPGGGYTILAIDLEGTEACDWLTTNGIACAVLKYRVPHSGPYWDDTCKCHITPPKPTALEDAQRAIVLLRSRAAELNIDPHKIGVLGFSAGGHVVAGLSSHTEPVYPMVDAADRQSTRPDFAIALYPGHLWVDEDKFELAPDIAVSPQTTPTLLVQSEDDPVDDINNSLVYYLALKRAGVSVELHVFAHGGHAFGLRRTEQPITDWPRFALAWITAMMRART